MHNVVGTDAPLFRKEITIRPSTNWYFLEIRHAKRETHKAKSALFNVQENYRKARTCFLKTTMTHFCPKKIYCGKNQRELFKIVISFLGESSVLILPNCTSALN